MRRLGGGSDDFIVKLAGVLPSRLAQPARDARVFDLMCGAVDHGTVYFFFARIVRTLVGIQNEKSTEELIK